MIFWRLGLGDGLIGIGGAILTYGENFPRIVQLYAQNWRDWSRFYFTLVEAGIIQTKMCRR